MNHSSLDSRSSLRAPRRRLSKPLTLFLVLAAVLTAAYVVASYLLGIYAEQQVDRYAKNAHTVAPIEVRVLHHQRGILESNGILQISAVAAASEPGATASPVAVMEVSYQIYHAILPNRLASLRWQAKQVQPQSMTHSDAVLDQTVSLTGQGELDWQGNYSGRVSMPATVKQIGSEKVALSTMQGEMRWGADQQHVSLWWPLIEARGESEGLRLSDFRWTIESSRGLSRHQVESERVYWPNAEVTGHGLKIEVDASQFWLDHSVSARSGVNALRWQLDADTLSVGKSQIRHLNVQGLLQGFRPEAFVRAVSTWLEPLHMLSAKARSENTFQNDISTLMMGGFDAQITSFTAQTDWANIQGQGQLLMRPVPQQANDTRQNKTLDTYISSKAEVYLQGLSPTMAGLGLLTGVLVRASDGVAMHYVLENGRLIVNGKAASPMIEKPVMALVNRWLNQLTGWQSPDSMAIQQTPDAQAFPVTP